ncbi:hypothetical protein HanPI659440_Chr07g0268901 [Helianthus annuus]|nr:hypothetical protein HanPI659440_Chr07g0268901 [Helianthus annuus]
MFCRNVLISPFVKKNYRELRLLLVLCAPDEEYEEYLSHVFGDKCTGNRNEMAQLPEGITELLQHEKLRVPLGVIVNPDPGLSLQPLKGRIKKPWKRFPRSYHLVLNEYRLEGSVSL